MNIGEGISGAIFSEDKRYRYALWRVWNREKPAVIFIGFNPSTADEIRDDPTVCKMARYAKDWGYGGLYIGNLFALCSSNPVDVFVSYRRHFKQSVVGLENDKYLQEMKSVAGIVVIGWGNNAEYSDRYKDVLGLLGKPVYYLGLTKKGQPAHPLYLKSEAELREY